MGSWIKDRSISTKLFLIAALATAATLLLGGISFLLMQQLESISSEITVSWLTGVNESRMADTYFTDYRLNERTYITSPTESSRQTGLDEVNALEGKLDDAINLYRTTMDPNDTEDLQLIEDVIRYWTEYKELHDRMFAAVEQGDTELAIRLLEDEGMDSYYSVKNALTALAEYNANGAYEAADRSRMLFERTVLLLIVVIIGVTALGMSLTLTIIRYIRRPVQEIEKATIELAKGNFDIEMTYRSKDELGRLSDNMRNLVQRFKTVIGDQSVFLDKLASGDFTVESQYPDIYLGIFGRLLSSLKTIANRLNETMLQISSASDQVSNGANLVANGSQALAQGSTEQAASIQELATSINDISHQVSQNAENAATASLKAQEMGVSMGESNQKMQKMVGAMTDINNSSHEISKIIKAIEDIAFQTNILALNAAVEAARAGSAGKGFAVVADEVRNLAAKSDQAAKSTRELIEHSIESVDSGALIVDETAKSLSVAIEGSQEVKRIVDEISQASSRQADAINQLTVSIDQISSVIQSNSATSEESAATSEELSSQAHLMKELVGAFRLRNSLGRGSLGDEHAVSAAAPVSGDGAFYGDSADWDKY